jgi:hypothetical protein
MQQLEEVEEEITDPVVLATILSSDHKVVPTITNA